MGFLTELCLEIAADVLGEALEYALGRLRRAGLSRPGEKDDKTPDAER